MVVVVMMVVMMVVMIMMVIVMVIVDSFSKIIVSSERSFPPNDPSKL
jgi:hypothetical protein